MHIGLVIYGTLEMQSGGFLYDRMIVKHLEQLGDKVSILSLPWYSYWRGLLSNFDEAIPFKLASGDWDILIEDELAHPALVRTNRRVHQMSRQRFPIISLVHLLHSTSQTQKWWQKWFFQQIESRYLRSVDGCIYVSQYNQKLAEQLAGRPIPFTIAYPAGDHLSPGIHISEINLRAAKQRPLEIIYLGSVIPRKGLHVLLAALEPVTFDWNLQVAGSLDVDPAYGTNIQKLAQKPGLIGKVHFLGALPQKEIPGLLAEGDVMALPSLAEGYAIAYLEAMAHGLPVIASQTSGAQELVVNNLNGFLIAPEDIQAVRTSLRALATDPKRRLMMSLQARETYDQHSTWAETAIKIRNFLEERISTFQDMKKLIYPESQPNQ